jgi:hypothetical protein
MSDERLTASIWVKAGPVSKGDILAEALLELRDKIPNATLPSAEIVSSKATKRDDEAGRLYTVEVTYRALKANEGTVTVDDIVADLQPSAILPDGDDPA